MIPIFTTAVQAIDYLTSGLEHELSEARIEERYLVTDEGLAVLIEIELISKERRQVIYLGDD